MKYHKQILLKNGKELIMRNGTADDAEELLPIFLQTHDETDYLVIYSDENTFTIEKESEFLQKLADSANEIEIIAIVDGKMVGNAGVVKTIDIRMKI